MGPILQPELTNPRAQLKTAYAGSIDGVANVGKQRTLGRPIRNSGKVPVLRRVVKIIDTNLCGIVLPPIQRCRRGAIAGRVVLPLRVRIFGVFTLVVKPPERPIGLPRGIAILQPEFAGGLLGMIFSDDLSPK